MMTIDEQRKRRVIDLYYNQGKTTHEIAKTERMSIRDISAILKEEEAKQQKHKDQQQQKDLSSKAYKLFSEKKSPIELAIILNLIEPEVTKLHKEYWKLRGRDILNLLYKETNGKIWIVLEIIQRTNKEKTYEY
jgi:5'-3' exonuclease